jgi:hypothetical protein
MYEMDKKSFQLYPRPQEEIRQAEIQIPGGHRCSRLQNSNPSRPNRPIRQQYQPTTIAARAEQEKQNAAREEVLVAP